MYRENSFSTMSMSEKEDRLKELMEMSAKMKNKREQQYLKRSIRPKKLNARMYKKMYRNARQTIKGLNQVNDMIAKDSCSGSKQKKQRVALESERVCFGNQESANESVYIASMDGAQCETLLKMGETADIERDFGGTCAICLDGGELSLCSGKGCGKSFHLSCIDPPLPYASPGSWLCDSCTKNKIKSGSAEISEFQFEVSSETRDHVLPYVNRLRDYWQRGQNAVFFDGQDRLVKVVLFVLSLLDNAMQPILILAATRVLSLWEAEFSKWSKLTNVVTYKGNKDVRAAIRASELYSENGSTAFQVLLSSPDLIFEDLEMFDHVKWELMVVDECQRYTISMHSKKFKMLASDMKLLTVTGEAMDARQNYQHILSLLDYKFEDTHTDADKETNDYIHVLKESLSPFIVFECKFNTPEIEEYWVPVHLSSMQTEQYFSILDSNLEALSSCIKNVSSIHGILNLAHKCCDHPYLVNPTLRNSPKSDVSIDPLSAEINVSGKLHILDKLLLEIKQSGLRVLVLFQPTESSEKISIGDILDDLVHQRFGQDSYIRISGKVPSRAARKKRKEILKMFNCERSRKFVCLSDYRACNSGIQLSHVDVVILFNNSWNPLHDIRIMQKITIDSHREPLRVFRLYSPFTVEEKALIFSKQGTPLDSQISQINWTTSHQLLAWGASYVFSKLQSRTGSKDPSSVSTFMNDLVHELSPLLKDTCNKTGLTNHSIISNAKLHDGYYSRSIILLGETEPLTKESLSSDEYLSENGPSAFWTKLFTESHLRQNNAGTRLSRRVQKSPPNYCYQFGGFSADKSATTSPCLKAKSKSKRKVHGIAKQSKQAGPHAHVGGRKSCPNQDEIRIDSPFFNPDVTQIAESTCISDFALNSRSNGVQQCENNQPARAFSSTPLETEIERVQKEREQVNKSCQEKKSMLVSECEKEVSEIHKKYDALINESAMLLAKEKKVLEDYYELVTANKLLAEILAQDFENSLKDPFLKKTMEGTGSVRIPASVIVPAANACSTSGPTGSLFSHSFGGIRLRAPAPNLRSNPSLFASFNNLPTIPEASYPEPFPTFSTPQIPTHIQTESNNASYQVNTEGLLKLLEEFDTLYGCS